MGSWARGQRTLSRYASGLPAAARAEWPSRTLFCGYLLLVAGLFLMSILATSYERFPGDVWLTREIQAMDVPGLRGTMRIATDVTSPIWSLFALACAVTTLLLLRQPRLALFAVAALSAHALGAILKLMVDRGRPDPDLVNVVRIEERFSYPSGHVEWVVAFEGFIVFTVWQLVPNAVVRWVVLALWLIHLCLTSAGRIDQGLHWPSDVVASYFVGAVALAAVIWAYRVSLRVVPPNSDS
jgi:undecaprenyl-diphosphatase